MPLLRGHCSQLLKCQPQPRSPPSPQTNSWPDGADSHSRQCYQGEGIRFPLLSRPPFQQSLAVGGHKESWAPSAVRERWTGKTRRASQAARECRLLPAPSPAFSSATSKPEQDAQELTRLNFEFLLGGHPETLWVLFQCCTIFLGYFFFLYEEFFLLIPLLPFLRPCTSEKSLPPSSLQPPSSQ